MQVWLLGRKERAYELSIGRHMYAGKVHNLNGGSCARCIEVQWIKQLRLVSHSSDNFVLRRLGGLFAPRSSLNKHLL